MEKLMEIFFALPQKDSGHIINKIFTPLGPVFLKHRNTLYKLTMQNLGDTWNPKGILKEPEITKFLSQIFFSHSHHPALNFWHPSVVHTQSFAVASTDFPRKHLFKYKYSTD